MSQPSNEEIVRAYLTAHAARDVDRLTELRHAEWTSFWPQSGELVRGDANARAIDANYPGGAPDVHADRVVGSEDRWVMTPAYTVQRIVGNGDSWWGEGTISYGGDLGTWRLAIFLEVRDGKVFSETVYYAEPFEPAAWRAPFVERIGDGTS